MAEARKCDRCGKFYENAEWQKADTVDGDKFTLVLSGMFRNIDLCPKCQASLLAWWERQFPKYSD